MDATDKKILKRVIEKDGFDYAMAHYSNYNGTVSFNHIKDGEFHRLRDLYVKARVELESYIMENVEFD